MPVEPAVVGGEQRHREKVLGCQPLLPQIGRAAKGLQDVPVEEEGVLGIDFRQGLSWIAPSNALVSGSTGDMQVLILICVLR